MEKDIKKIETNNNSWHVGESLKLAKASATLMDVTPAATTLGFGSVTEPDKMDIPTSWSDLVKMIRFYYERDPVASTVVNKSVDIGINEIINNQGETEERVQEVYDSIKDQLQAFMREVGREYQLSGLVIPEINWANKTIKHKDGSSAVYRLPESMWLRDPSTIIARKTPIPNRINYYLEIDEDIYEFIINKGVYPDGTRDRETYELLRRNYPKFVGAVENGETEFPLENLFIVIRRAPITGKAYPTPYLLAALEPLRHKRNLRKMDYSIAARVISAIQLITLGSDEFPLTESDEDQLNDLKGQMRHEGRENNVERVFQLFGNHTLKISWIFPDTQAMLNDEKYKTVNQDIMFGLGFPRILLSGETERSATSNPEFAMFSPSETLKAMRNDLLPFARKLYAEIARLNGFDNYPTLEFGALRLYDVEKMSNVVDKLLGKASLSRTSALRAAGFDFGTEIENIAREMEIMKENDVPEFLPQPFTPQPNKPQSNTDTEEPGG